MNLSLVADNPGMMSEADYDAARAKLAPNKRLASIRWEQELAVLFHRSGWTQERLARKEGKAQSWVNNRMRFGRFLNFISMEIKADYPSDLSERTFRSCWSRTDTFAGNERQRFDAVLDLITSDAADDAMMEKTKKPASWRDDLRKTFGDGKWHQLRTIANHLEETEEEASASMRALMRDQRSATYETKMVGTEPHYRIFPKDKTVSVRELTEKLTPIVKGLLAEGRKSTVTMSPPTVATLAAKLRDLLDEWVE